MSQYIIHTFAIQRKTYMMLFTYSGILCRRQWRHSSRRCSRALTRHRRACSGSTIVGICMRNSSSHIHVVDGTIVFMLKKVAVLQRRNGEGVICRYMISKREIRRVPSQHCWDSQTPSFAQCPMLWSELHIRWTKRLCHKTRQPYDDRRILIQQACGICQDMKSNKKWRW